MEYAEVFISYKSEEEATARHVREVLEANGITCWMAPDSIPTGSNYMKQIPQAIEHCKAMVILISQKSQQSTWVKNEFSEAVSKDKLIIPYVIQDCPLEDEFAFSMSTMQQVYAWKDEDKALEKIVRDIRTALGESDSAKVEISVVHKTKPDMRVIIAAVLAVCVLIGVFVFTRSDRSKGSDSGTGTGQAQVYYSEVLPYVLTGYYATASEAMNDDFSIPIWQKAFSLLAFIRNDSGSDVFVEKIACDLLNVTPVQEPVIQNDGILQDGVITGIVYNDGWGDADAVTSSWTVHPDEGIPSFPSFEESLSGTSTSAVASGSAASILSVAPDFSELLAWARSEQIQYATTLYTLLLNSKYEDQEAITAIFLMYDPKQDDIIATYGGADDEKPTITLYGVLNVDNPPASLRFTGPDAAPVVEDTFRIETVIIPTKSCEVTLKGSYLIGGKAYETETYDVRVQVPYFDETSFFVGGPLTRELANTNMNDPVQVNRVCMKYRYDIESILPPEAPRG